MKHHTVYMEKNALAFLRSWPDVPETLRPVYARFYDVGLIWSDPSVESDGKTWPGSLRLTERGERLREIVTAQSYNHFISTQFAEIMPEGYRQKEYLLIDEDRRIFKDDLPSAGYQVRGPQFRAEPESSETDLLDCLAILEAATAVVTRKVRKLFP